MLPHSIGKNCVKPCKTEAMSFSTLVSIFANNSKDIFLFPIKFVFLQSSITEVVNEVTAHIINDKAMAAINDLIEQIEDEGLRQRINEELRKLLKQKKFGLVFEEHQPEGLTEGPVYPYLQKIDQVEHASGDSLWHTLIESDNYYALQLLVYLYPGMVDCIYIDPPYNTGARDWKYNNDYVDSSDQFREEVS